MPDILLTVSAGVVLPGRGLAAGAGGIVMPGMGCWARAAGPASSSSEARGNDFIADDLGEQQKVWVSRDKRSSAGFPPAGVINLVGLF